MSNGWCMVSEIEIQPFLKDFKFKLGFRDKILLSSRPKTRWVFGRSIKGREVYIKITMGKTNEDPICTSFHFSEFPMIYPYKDK